jgi:hypothetical protein
VIDFRRGNALSSALVIVVLNVTLVAHAAAADAVFSKDGNHVYTIDDEQGGRVLQDIDLANRKLVEIPLQPPSDATEFVDLSRTNDGNLLVLGKNALWEVSVSTKKWKKLCAAPPNLEFERVASDPKRESTLLMTHTREARLFVLAKDASELQPVWIRRHDVTGFPVFDSDGQLFFGYWGEIWCGSIERDPEFRERPFLAAYSYAPIASLETSNGTPGESGVYEIAPARDFLYVQTHRIGGSGWAALVKVPRPRPKRGKYGDFDVHFDIKERLAIYANALRNAEVVHSWYTDCLCASPDGTRVYFEDRTNHFLIINGKLQQIEIAEP